MLKIKTQPTSTCILPKNIFPVFNLDTLRAEVYLAANNQENIDSTPLNFPSVCLIGLGRCGSNIALGVASLVHSARKYYLNEFNSDE